MADIYVKSDFPIITAITKANPAQVTTEAAHGLTTGDKIGISGVGGMTQVNNLGFTVTVVDSTNFTLDSTDSTSYTTYTNSGYVHKGLGAGTYRGPWLAGTSFATGDRIYSRAVSRYLVGECTTAGTSAASGFGPTLPASGSTVTDGTVVWTSRAPTSWANATFSLAFASLDDASGDTYFVSNNHKEVVSSDLLFEGIANNVKIVCADDSSGSPPSTQATTALIKTYGGSYLMLSATGTKNYWYGINFEAGSGAGGTNIAPANGGNTLTFEKCTFSLLGTGSGARMFCSGYTNSNASAFYFRDCDFRFSSTGQGFAVNTNGHTFNWLGGKITSASSAVTTLFITINAAIQDFKISGVDLSAGAASMVIIAASQPASGIVVRDCKLPASWTGSIISGTPIRRVGLHNSDATDTNYRVEVKDVTGTQVQETTVVRSGGATDGTTALSWKLTSNSTSSYLLGPFYSEEIVRWNETTGSSITVTVETLTDNVTLKDDECWLEVMYLGTSGYPLGTWISDAKASPVATAANQPTSSVTWTTTGITTPVKQYLSVSFTPQEKGFIHARVCVGKASTTVYVDPKLTVS